MLKCGVRHLLVGFSLAAASRGAPAQDATPANPSLSRFASDSPLTMTLRTDVRGLLRDRSEDRKNHDGIARLQRPDGGMDSVAIEPRTRGVFRRRPALCAFPPLRLSIGAPRRQHEDRLAARHGMRVLEDTGTHIARVDPAQTAFMAVFQYFIGNADWSIRALHNIVLLPDSASRALPVPYDFDWAGSIATRYAVPDTSLPIRSVKERLYSGYCGSIDDFEPVLARFRQHRTAIEALYDLEPLERDERSRARRYYAEFYRLIDDPARVRGEMLKLCQ